MLNPQSDPQESITEAPSMDVVTAVPDAQPDKEILAEKTALLTALQEAGVTVAVIEYSGCGDSGQVDTIELQPSGIGEAATIRKLEEQLEGFTALLIDHYHCGYENNEGGGGSVTIDVVAGTVQYDSYDYYTETEDHPQRVI